MKRSLRFAIVGLLVCIAFTAKSAPIWNYPQKLTQPDGSVIRCFASGDEFNHWLHDKDNYTIVQHPSTGYFVYAVLGNGELIPSDYIVGRVDPSSVGLTSGVHGSLSVATQRRDAFNAMVAGVRRNAPRAAFFTNIVVFVRFADESRGVFPDSTAPYDRMFNSSSAGASSLYNYYNEVSYGQLTVSSTFYPIATDSVQSYQDAYARNYYRPYNGATNPIGYTTDNMAATREQALVKNASNAVAAQISTGLNIDENGDGYIDKVCLLISGGPDGWTSQLWPHTGWLTSHVVTINGKRVGNYEMQFRDFLFLETRGVGTLCHEMFHILGAPDLYNYTNHLQPNELFPVWIWDVMGCRYQPNPMVNPPQHMGAYMKYEYGGWIASIPTIPATGRYTLSPLVSSTNNCYKILSPYASTEFFVVEYRKRSGTFESSLPGEGLLVYRINVTVGGDGSGPPDEVYVYRPGGTDSTNGTPDSAGFSANSGRTSISDSTNPSSFLSNGLPGGLRITDVGFMGDTIGFTVELPTSAVDRSTESPRAFFLGQNYPNPFNPTTKIQFTIDNRQLTIVKVFDVLGRDVATLVHEVKQPGTYTVEFDGSNLASGVYFYRLTAGDFVQTKRLLLLK